MIKNLSIKCVKGQKIGDSLLKLDDGNLLSIYPDTFYNKGLKGFWMVKRIGDWLKILKFLRAWAMSAVAYTPTPPNPQNLKVWKFPHYWGYIKVNKNLTCKPF